MDNGDVSHCDLRYIIKLGMWDFLTQNTEFNTNKTRNLVVIETRQIEFKKDFKRLHLSKMRNFNI